MKKYQIFVSSTFEDLQEERQIIIEAILNCGHIPAGMELFCASSDEQFEYIKKIINNCDYYVLISAGRYGSINPIKQIGYTEQEYDYAVSKGIPALVFLHRHPFDLPYSKRDDENRERLEKFRQKVSKGKMCKYWDDKAKLVYSVVASLTQIMEEYPMIGWTRAAGEKELQDQIKKLTDENHKLQLENENLINQMQNSTCKTEKSDAKCYNMESKKIKIYFRDDKGRMCYENGIFSLDEIFMKTAPYIHNCTRTDFERILFCQLSPYVKIASKNIKIVGVSDKGVDEVLNILIKENFIEAEEKEGKDICINLSIRGISYFNKFDARKLCK